MNGVIRRLRSWDGELIANRASHSVFDFGVSRYGRASPVGRISVDGVVGALSVQMAAVFLEVPQQVAAFHAAGTSIESVSQIAVPGRSLAAFSRYD